VSSQERKVPDIVGKPQRLPEARVEWHPEVQLRVSVQEAVQGTPHHLEEGETRQVPRALPLIRIDSASFSTCVPTRYMLWGIMSPPLQDLGQQIIIQPKSCVIINTLSSPFSFLLE
jgi:hypothetical protein